MDKAFKTRLNSAENAGDILDILNDMASSIDIIPLANLLWKEEQELCFFPDNRLVEMWDREIKKIQKVCKDDLAKFESRLLELDIFSERFLNSLDSCFQGTASSLMGSLSRLQESIHTEWKSRMSGNAFFPLFEKTFREGEFEKLSNVLRDGKAEAKRSLESVHAAAEGCLPGEQDILCEELRQQYLKKALLASAVLRESMDRIISFYDKKWRLFLSSK